jgi:hypothetical protein
VRSILRGATAILVALVGLMGAGLFCMHEVDAMPLRIAQSRPLVAWRSGGEVWAKNLFVDSSGHFVASAALPAQKTRAVVGQLQPLELARLQHELGEVDWRRASFAGCDSESCDTLVLGEGTGAAKVRRALGYGSRSLASEELAQVYAHLREVYGRSMGTTDSK